MRGDQRSGERSIYGEADRRSRPDDPCRGKSECRKTVDGFEGNGLCLYLRSLFPAIGPLSAGSEKNVGGKKHVHVSTDDVCLVQIPVQDDARISLRTLRVPSVPTSDVPVRTVLQKTKTDDVRSHAWTDVLPWSASRTQILSIKAHLKRQPSLGKAF